MSYEQLTELIYQLDSFLIIIHIKPDGDSVASAMALKLGFEKIGKKVTVICSHKIPQNFLFLNGTKEIKHDAVFGDHKLIFLIDCGDLERTGFKNRLESYSKNGKLINIDHHPKNDLHKIAHFNIIEYNASATVEIIDQLLAELKVKIDKSIATCLLTGLITDTGGFRHNNTTSKSFLLASSWLKTGASLNKISKNFSNYHNLKNLKLKGLIFGRLKINSKYKIATSCLSLDDLARINASVEDTKGIINNLVDIPEINWAMLFIEEKEGLIRVTIRNKLKGVNIKNIAQIFGGKGRNTMAGFVFKGCLNLSNNDWKVTINE